MPKIKVPDSIKIGGHKYKIILDSSHRLLDGSLNAEVNHRKEEIRINATRPDSQRREALIHEILHCVDRVYLDNTLDEKSITHTAEGLNQAFDELGIQFKWPDVKRTKGKIKCQNSE